MSIRVALVCADDSQYVGLTGIERAYYALHNVIRVKKNFGYLNEHDVNLFSNINHQHRGLLSIAEVLMNKGYHVDYFHAPRIFDTSIHYDIVGFSAYTQNIEKARELSTSVKKENPTTITILGGAHANGVDGGDLAGELSFFDYIVKGKGERAMLSILEALQFASLKLIDSSLGIYSKGENNARPAVLLRELQVSPSILHNAYSLIPVTLPAARVFFSEGCVYRCAFCANQRNRIVLYDLDLVRQEIDILTGQYGTKYVYIGDENFHLGSKRSLQIIDLMNSYSHLCRWAFQTRVCIPPTEALARLDPESCVEVQFGIEHADDHIRDLISKDYGSLADIYRAIDVYLERGLNLLTYFIVGLPGETSTTIKKNFEVMCNLINKGVMVEIGIFVPYPGTPIFKVPQKYGIHIDKSSWDKFRSDGVPPYNYEDGLTGEQIREHFDNGLKSYIIPAYRAKYESLLPKAMAAECCQDTLGSPVLWELPW